MPDDTRNFVEEALRIAKGESVMLAQKEHLVALVQQNVSVNRHLRLLVKLLVAILIDNGVASMQFSPDALAKTETGMSAVNIKAEPDGGVTVTRRVLPQAAAAVN